MAVQFHVLASGSSGNACVLDVDGFGVLLDFGLSPRQLAPRMKRCRVAWERIHAVLLTHDHTDHWQAATLAHFAKLRLPIYCHEEHVQAFDPKSRAFSALSAAGLFRHYQTGKRLKLNAECQCLPIALSHDGTKTTGFRFEGAGWAIGYAADLGCWQPALAKKFADVDLLALEFNHDVKMQLVSGRHPRLIRRVLSDTGHLSNDQAAVMLAEILKISEPGRVRHLVQLHLSRQCNRPELAKAAAQQVVDRLGIDLSIHTTDQECAGPSITLDEGASMEPKYVQPMLPFAVGSSEPEA
jgi:phosphoribosyl 1,2-cyclic phosphodiesterase